MKFSSFHIISLLVALIAFPAAAQKVQWSLPQKAQSRTTITEVAGQNKEGIFVIKRSWRRQDKEVVIEKYSTDMRLTASQTFLDHKSEAYQDLVLQENELQLFFTVYDKNSEQTELRVLRISNNLKPLAEDSLILTLPGYRHDDKFLLIVNHPPHKDALILFNPGKSDIPQSLSTMLLDTDLSTVSTSTIDIGIDRSFEIEDVAYDSGHAALLVREDVKQRVNTQGYQFYIYEGPLAGSSYSRTAIFNDSTDVIEGLLKTDFKNGQIVFAGLYSMKDSSYAKGYYVWRRDHASGRTSTGYYPFSNTIVDELAGKRSKVQGVYHLRTGDVALRSDGGIILTCEEYQESRETIMDMNMYGMTQTNFRYNYYYENLLVLSIGPDNGMDWHTVVRKEQISVNDNGQYSSYLLTVLPDKLVYIFNDLSRKNWNLSAYEIYENGNGVNSIVLRSQEYDGRLIPQYGRQIAYNELLIPGSNRRGMVLLKVSY